jgi:hypothetical protein
MRMEERTENQDYRVRMNVHQLANGQLRYEVTVRADTTEEAEAMLKDAVERAKKVCDEQNSLM